MNTSAHPPTSTTTAWQGWCEGVVWALQLLALALLYVCYLGECWSSEAHRLLRRPRVSAAEARLSLRRWRDAEPVVWWRAVSYHYAPRRRRRTRHRRGQTLTSSHQYYERVNSHVVSATYDHSHSGVGDISPDLQLPLDGPLTIITFTKGFTFANVYAMADLEEERASFFARNGPRDRFLEKIDAMDVQDFQEELLVACGDWTRWLHNVPAYWLCSLLLLSWPLQLLYHSRTAYVQYELLKIFGSNFRRPGTSGIIVNNNNNRRSRCDSEEPFWALCVLPSRSQSSQDSVDLDNVSVIPSYSEALLMDAAPRAPRHTMTHDFTRDRVTHCPDDPLEGREATTPREDPPDYEEALQLATPMTSLLRRSFTDTGDLRRCAILSIETSL